MKNKQIGNMKGNLIRIKEKLSEIKEAGLTEEESENEEFYASIYYAENLLKRAKTEINTAEKIVQTKIHNNMKTEDKIKERNVGTRK